MENPESLEEGLIAKSSLAQPNTVIVTNEVGERSGFPESDNSSAATPVVVLSTLVAICGSFAHGCSVSSIPLSCMLVTFFCFLILNVRKKWVDYNKIEFLIDFWFSILPTIMWLVLSKLRWQVQYFDVRWCVFVKCFSLSANSGIVYYGGLPTWANGIVSKFHSCFEMQLNYQLPINSYFKPTE